MSIHHCFCQTPAFGQRLVLDSSYALDHKKKKKKYPQKNCNKVGYYWSGMAHRLLLQFGNENQVLHFLYFTGIIIMLNFVITWGIKVNLDIFSSHLSSFWVELCDKLLFCFQIRLSIIILIVICSMFPLVCLKQLWVQNNFGSEKNNVDS